MARIARIGGGRLATRIGADDASLVGRGGGDGLLEFVSIAFDRRGADRRSMRSPTTNTTPEHKKAEQHEHHQCEAEDDHQEGNESRLRRLDRTR